MMKTALKAFILMTICLTYECLVLAQEDVDPQLSKRSPGLPPYSRYVRNRRFRAPKCLVISQECIPELTTCCGNLKCSNGAGPYCLYPLEKCYCNSPLFYNSDSYGDIAI